MIKVEKSTDPGAFFVCLLLRCPNQSRVDQSQRIDERSARSCRKTNAFCWPYRYSNGCLELSDLLCSGKP